MAAALRRTGDRRTVRALHYAMVSPTLVLLLSFLVACAEPPTTEPVPPAEHAGPRRRLRGVP